jgi:uncharacterized membrane protein
MSTDTIEVHTRQRTFFKSLSWRIFATGQTILIAFLLTGTLDVAIKVGLPDFALKFACYYIFERIWLVGALQHLKMKRIIKMLSWKVVAVSLSMSITYIVTGEMGTALRLGPIDTTLKTLILYLHELLWDCIPYGKTVAKKKSKKED